MVSMVFHRAKRSLFLPYFHSISLYYFTELPAAAGISTLFRSYFYLLFHEAKSISTLFRWYFYLALFNLTENQFDRRKSQDKSQKVGQELGAPFFGPEIGAKRSSCHSEW